MWNVVYVDGEWCFVDCMWGVGNCDEMKKFYFDYYDYFYFMDLDYFILIYFFYECDINMVIVWQFFQELWFLDKFNVYIKLSMRVIEWGVEFVLYQFNVVFINVVFIFELKSRKILLVFNGEFILEKGESNRVYLYVYKCGLDVYKIVVRLLLVGKFLFCILVNFENDEEVFFLVLYVIKCLSIDGFVCVFLYYWGIWGFLVDLVNYGFIFNNVCFLIMVENGEIEIKLLLEKELEVLSRLIYVENFVKESDNYVLIEINGGNLYVCVRFLKEGYYKL